MSENETFLLLWVCGMGLWNKTPSVFLHHSPSHLKTLIPSFNECADRLVEKLTPLADGVTLVPMKKELSIVTLDVISNVSLGVGACKTISTGLPVKVSTDCLASKACKNFL